MMNTKQVAEALGVNYTSLKLWLKGAGIKPTSTEAQHPHRNLYDSKARSAIAAMLKTEGHSAGRGRPRKS
jgi:predicted site-specific integrase-resolvase